MVDSFVNWEVESYRAKVSLASGAEKKLNGKVAIVTGSAQGFGAGIAEYLASEGAAVVIADMNYDGALRYCRENCRRIQNSCSRSVRKCFRRGQRERDDRENRSHLRRT